MTDYRVWNEAAGSMAECEYCFKPVKRNQKWCAACYKKYEIGEQLPILYETCEDNKGERLI